MTLRLNAIAHHLPAGHCWRLSISPTYWPHAWPSPEAVTLTLYLGQEIYLALPARSPQPQDEIMVPFEPPERAPFLAHERLRSESRQRTVEHDLIGAKWTLRDYQDGGHVRLEGNGLEFGSTDTNIYTIVEGDPLSATARCDRTVSLGRGDWQTRVETSSLMSAAADHFLVTNTLDAYEDHTRIFTRSWSCRIPRNLV